MVVRAVTVERPPEVGGRATAPVVGLQRHAREAAERRCLWSGAPIHDVATTYTKGWGVNARQVHLHDQAGRPVAGRRRGFFLDSCMDGRKFDALFRDSGSVPGAYKSHFRFFVFWEKQPGDSEAAALTRMLAR